MFSLIRVGERSGMGLCDIYSYFDESGLSKPTIKETIDPDCITLTLNINDNNYISTKNIADCLNVSARTIQRAIKRLEEDELIKMLVIGKVLSGRLWISVK